MNKKLIAIVTPTYNRAYIIQKLYDSLLNQTSYNFTWYIIDDGSKDNLKDVVDGFNTNKFAIKYFYKNNGGKHTALNESYKHITEPLTIIVDSDDILTADAIETIEKDYPIIQDRQDVCAISYLKGYSNGENIGNKYTKDCFFDTYINERINKSVLGDKAEVYKTDLLNQYPFPVIQNERFISEAVVWCKLSGPYKMYFVNKTIYVADYLEDGLTKHAKQLIFNNPHGASLCYAEMSKKPIKFTKRVKYMLAYMAYSNIAGLKKKEQYKNTANKFLYILLFLPAQILTLVLRRKYGKKK